MWMIFFSHIYADDCLTRMIKKSRGQFENWALHFFAAKYRIRRVLIVFVTLLVVYFVFRCYVGEDGQVSRPLCISQTR